MSTMNAIKYVENWHDVLHADVIRVLRDLYSAYEYSSDSTLDGFNNELLSIIDPEAAHDDAFLWRTDDDGTMTDVDRRNAETEVAYYTAIRTHLSVFDMEVLHMIPDVWGIVDNAEDEGDFERVLFGHLVAIADFIERNK